MPGISQGCPRLRPRRSRRRCPWKRSRALFGRGAAESRRARSPCRVASPGGSQEGGECLRNEEAVLLWIREPIQAPIARGQEAAVCQAIEMNDHVAARRAAALDIDPPAPGAFPDGAEAAAHAVQRQRAATSLRQPCQILYL